MPCYRPMTAWYGKEVNTSGKRSLVFDQRAALQPDDPVEISCGQCIGCKLERSRQWAIRCMHEASLYKDNVFLTLTFNEEEIWRRENPYSLNKRDFQLFIKRLRKRRDGKIRYFHCGEYGDSNGRPHYHAVVFNCCFPDQRLWSITNGERLFVSDELESLWPYGFSTIGEVTFESAAYVARYALKKITGELAEEHYTWIDERTGELLTREPEYVTMSRRPGIGKEWFDKFKRDCFPSDFITVKGQKMKIPKYYDKLLEDFDEYELSDIKLLRKERQRFEENTEERLSVKEEIQRSRLKLLPRNL